MKDKLADYTMEQVKSAYMAERIINRNPCHGYGVSFGFGEESDLEIKVEEKTHNWGSHSWTSRRQYMHYTLKPTWYSDVYLQGLGCVTYKNKTALVLDAAPATDITLREDLALPDFRVYRVKMPNWVEQPRANNRWYKVWDVELADRFMVVTDINDGEDSIAYAALHANAAAANLKKNLMNKMSQMMGV